MKKRKGRPRTHRNAIVYARVSKPGAKWLQEVAKRTGRSQSAILDDILMTLQKWTKAVSTGRY